MTTLAVQLRAIKLRALAWVAAKRALEDYACAVDGEKLDSERLAALTGKYLGAERDLEAAVAAIGG